MINLVPQGLTFDDPTMQILLFQHNGMLTTFDPDTQLEEAVGFLKENENDITFVYMGEVGEYVGLPGIERRGGSWIGFSSSDKESKNIEGDDLLSIMQGISQGTHSFYIYRK